MTSSQGKTQVDIAADESTMDKPRDHAPAPERPADPGLDRPTQGRIGDQLRAMYDDLLNQPVPDRLADLLKRLDGQ